MSRFRTFRQQPYFCSHVALYTYTALVDHNNGQRLDDNDESFSVAHCYYKKKKKYFFICRFSSSDRSSIYSHLIEKPIRCVLSGFRYLTLNQKIEVLKITSCWWCRWNKNFDFYQTKNNWESQNIKTTPYLVIHALKTRSMCLPPRTQMHITHIYHFPL